MNDARSTTQTVLQALQTAEKTAENYRRQLRASRAYFHAIVTKSADGVVVLNSKGIICYVNPAAELLLGRPTEELLGEMFGIPLVPGEATEIELLQADDTPRIAEMRVVETEWQEHSAYLATLRDITEHKLAERRAREAVRRRDEFLAMLSHELRNPLAAIVNAARVMRRRLLDESSFERSAEIIERQCHQMTRLLHDLLEVSRISQGKIELKTEYVDLKPVIAEALESVAPQVECRNHLLQVELPNQPTPVFGDPARLNQVFANLVMNAAKYTDNGGTISLWMVVEGNEIVIHVADNGSGIEPGMLEEIFEPFVQAQENLARSNTGMGVGLALVRNLVELHGGTVRAQSDGPGKGSEFIVRLPLATVHPEAAAPAPEKVQPAASGERRILLVEDNDDAREMLMKLLQLDGHEVEYAVDGQEAITRIEFHQPDVALVDIGLPVLDGYEVARRVRANPANRDVFLIALTGYGQSEDRRRALDAGFDAHLIKPVDLDALYILLANLNHRPPPRTIAQTTLGAVQIPTRRDVL